jgi:hypothetical protein
MVQKGESFGKQGEEEYEMNFFWRIIGRVGSTCDRKPKTLF